MMPGTLAAAALCLQRLPCRGPALLGPSRWPPLCPRGLVALQAAISDASSPPLPSKRAALRARCMCPWEELLSQLEAGKGPDCIVVLCGVAPGNLGAILRTCVLLGVAAVVVLEGLSHSAVTRALRTSQVERRPHWEIALVPVPEDITPASALGRLRMAGIRLIGLTADYTNRGATPPLWEVDLGEPGLGLVFGRDVDDGRAFSEGVEECLDGVATVPMCFASGTDTLNVSHTVSIVVYEHQRQRLMLSRQRQLFLPNRWGVLQKGRLLPCVWEIGRAHV